MDEIKNNFYHYPALLPPLVWLKANKLVPPRQLKIMTLGKSILLSWESAKQSQREKVFYNVYRSKDKQIDVCNASNLIATRVIDHTFSIPMDSSGMEGYYYAITSYDRYHNESEISESVYFKVK